MKGDTINKDISKTQRMTGLIENPIKYAAFMDII